LYQSAHAGYSPLAVDVWHYILITPFTLQATILPSIGTPWQRLLESMVELSFVFCAGMLWLIRRALRAFREQTVHRAEDMESIAGTSTMVIATTIGISLLLALLLSTRSNLIQPRCLSIFTPLCLIALVAAAEHQWLTARHVVAKVGLSLGAVAMLGIYGSGMTKLLTHRKSNARELASSISARSKSTDLLLLMPVWLASSFNHYFESSNEQIDYPREGREEAVDFADMVPRLRDSAALTRTVKRLTEARAEGRRVWLISERMDTIPHNSKKPIDFMKPPDTLVVHIRLQQVRNALVALYGPPDTTLARGISRDRYEHLIAYLFTPSRLDSASRPSK
jgi:hypothetical protein